MIGLIYLHGVLLFFIWVWLGLCFFCLGLAKILGYPPSSDRALSLFRFWTLHGLNCMMMRAVVACL